MEILDFVVVSMLLSTPNRPGRLEIEARSIAVRFSPNLDESSRLIVAAE